MQPTANQIERMVRIATQRAPHEACGIIATTGDVRELPNRAAEPHNGFRIDPSELPPSYSAIWHSHPDGSVEPSESDQYSCKACAVPFWIVSPSGAWATLQPEECPQLALVGRTFLHGVVDCYTLVQDYFAHHHKQQMPNFYREDRWWEDPDAEPLYGEHNLNRAGFRRLVYRQDPSVIRPEDVLIMRIGKRVKHDNHAAIYVGSNAILHHMPDHLSREQPLSQTWLRRVTCIARHWALDPEHDERP